MSRDPLFRRRDGPLTELGAERRVARAHEAVFVPPGARHAIYNTDLADPAVIVVTSRPEDTDAESV